MTYPGQGGQQPRPFNAPAGQAVYPGIQPGVSGNVVRAKLIIVSGSGEGVFVYNGVPGLGNPPIFWVSSVGVDPYGNVITPTAGIAGTGQFTAGDTIINAQGMFIYGGTPAAGNLIGSISNTTGTDTFGNAWLQGIADYFNNGTFYTASAVNGGVVGWYVSTVAPYYGGPWAQAGGIGVGFATGPVYTMVMSGMTNINMEASGQVSLGLLGNCIWEEGVQQFVLPAAGGPFIGGESFHAVSLGTGLSGTMRVKMLPWNAVFLDAVITFNYTSGAQNITCGSLPSFAYYPVGTHLIPGGLGGTPTGIASSFPRLQVPAGSGALAVLIPSGTGTTINLTFSAMWPTN